eukprot:1676478-Rhodomonas_salina.1
MALLYAYQHSQHQYRTQHSVQVGPHLAFIASTFFPRAPRSCPLLLPRQMQRESQTRGWCASSRESGENDRPKVGASSQMQKSSGIKNRHTGPSCGDSGELEEEEITTFG